MRKARVFFQLSGREAEVPLGCTVLEAAWRAGEPVDSPCGGRGKCGKCRVRVKGDAAPATPRELEKLTAGEMGRGWRLACQAEAAGDVSVRTPARVSGGESGTPRSLLRARGIKPAPRVEKTFLKLRAPSLRSQKSDLERVIEALGGGDGMEVSLDVMKTLPGALRAGGFGVTAVTCGGRLAAVEPGDTTPVLAGAAVDVGTTTLSVSVYDLRTGDMIGGRTAINPQERYGADVASRIFFAAEREGGLETLRKIVVDALNGMLNGAARDGGVDPGGIYEVVAVGNPTMMHLLGGVSPENIAAAPYVPAFSGALDVPARDVGLEVSPGARIRVPPAVSAYVGADTIGAVLAAGIGRGGECELLVDMGTNAEIVLSGRGGMAACSAAAGPALEGAQISCGTRAKPGAVQHVFLDAGALRYATIGGLAPSGLCGSALMDAMAELRLAGAIDGGGRLDPARLRGEYAFLKRNFVREKGGGERFALRAGSEGVFLTQGDVRQFQLAKSAIITGIQALLKKERVRAREIGRIYLAGLLGSSLRAESAIEAGVLPDVDAEGVKYVGNAALDGAAMCLLSERAWRRAVDTAGKMKCLELSGWRGFQELFVKNLEFPPYRVR
ncbi:MAG: ASKHA domain-containing protein [bacterium]